MENLAPLAFGRMLKAFRRRQHLTQQELADKLEVHRNTIILWEGDQPFPGTKAMVFRIASHLRLSEEENRQLLEASLTRASLKWNVPYPRNPFFTGREEILETLHKCLAGEQAVALTQSYALSGLGGIGKTHLAVEYTYRHELDYSAILWIAAESAETIRSSFVGIAELLRLPERQEADQQQIVAAVQCWLGTHRQWLLVFDNVEDLGLLQGFLPATNQGAVLITTRRQALGTLAQDIELSPMSPEEGLLLLLRRAKVLSPQAGLSQVEELEAQSHGEYQTAQQLVAAIGGLPLALDQAGAYIEETSCSLADYLELFQTRQVQLLRRRGEVGCEHPASVVATWSLSFEKVERANPLASNLLRLCAFLHADSIPEEILMQGITFLDKQPEIQAADRFQLHEAMRAVSTYSLLRRQGKVRTYSMHRLVQAVLRDGMDEAQGQQWMERVVHVVNAVWPEVEPTTWWQYERLLPQALVCTHYQLHSEQSHLELASLLFKTASYLLERFQPKEAESLFLRALQIREQMLTDSHPDVARSLNGLAQLYGYRGQLEKEKQLYQRALHIFEQALPDSHPDLATLLNNLATRYTQQGKHAEAEALFQQALSILEQAWGPQHLDVARSLNNLAMLHHVQGQLEQAEPLYQRAFSLWQQMIKTPHPGMAIPLNNLANLYRHQERLVEAEPLYLHVLSTWEQTLGPLHLSVAYALLNLVTLYTQQGRLAEAEPLSQRAVSVWEATRDFEHSPASPKLKSLKALGAGCFGHLFLSLEKHGQMILFNPHTFNSLANLYPTALAH